MIFSLRYVLQKPEIVTSSRKYRVRVLVCAPSNSALDEIVLRLLNTGMPCMLSFPHIISLAFVIICIWMQFDYPHKFYNIFISFLI